MNNTVKIVFIKNFDYSCNAEESIKNQVFSCRRKRALVSVIENYKVYLFC